MKYHLAKNTLDFVISATEKILQLSKIHIKVKNETKHEQHLLKDYPKPKFGTETFTRQFNVDFHKVYPW